MSRALVLPLLLLLAGCFGTAPAPLPAEPDAVRVVERYEVEGCTLVELLEVREEAGMRRFETNADRARAALRREAQAAGATHLVLDDARADPEEFGFSEACGTCATVTGQAYRCP